MSYSTILAEVKEALNDVADIGNVHDYERLAADHGAFLTLFKPSGKSYIRGWEISRISAPCEWDAAQHVWRTHAFSIKGYHSIDDSAATEKTFQALVDTLMDHLNTKVTYEGAATLAGPAQLVTFQNRSFGDVAVHYCEIQIRISEYLQVTVDDT